MIQDSSPEVIIAIKDQLNTPFERTYQHNWNVQTQQFEPKTIQYSNPVFSFWNIVAPTADIMAEYEGQAPKTKSGLDDMTAWHKEIREIGQTSNDWYNWNNRNWGTKWDVAVSDESEYHDTDITHSETDLLGYRFDTAWAPPVQAMIHLSNQYPTAIITLSWEEEQGFGGKIEFIDGQVTHESNYDSRCFECDKYDTMEYCEDCENNVCTGCRYGMLESCNTHKEEISV